MNAILTTKTRLNNAEQFKESFGESGEIYYMTLGRVTPWDTETSPDTAVNTLYNEMSIWYNMFGGKNIGGSDVSAVIARRNWTTGTSYKRYDDRDGTIMASAFYVINDNYHVYKCIDNNNGDVSTVMPTGTGISVITLADGFKCI